MDDNLKTIISSNSAELVEGKAKLNRMLIGLNFLIRPTLDETLWCDIVAVLPSPFSFLCCSLACDCSLQNNKIHFHISIRSFFLRLLFSGHYNFLKLIFLFRCCSISLVLILLLTEMKRWNNKNVKISVQNKCLSFRTRLFNLTLSSLWCKLQDSLLPWQQIYHFILYTICYIFWNILFCQNQF